MTEKPALPLANPAPSTALASFLAPPPGPFDREIEATAAKIRSGALEKMAGPEERAAFVLGVLNLARDAAKAAREARQQYAAALETVKEAEATRQRIEAAFAAWAEAHGADPRL